MIKTLIVSIFCMLLITASVIITVKFLRKNSSMIKKVIMPIFGMLLIATSIFITVYSFGITVEGYGRYCVSDYDEFYLHKTDNSGIAFNFGDGTSTTYKIWFSPGNKEKMLNKIKEDVNSELEQIKNNNSDIIKDYSVSDDFTTVDVFYFDDTVKIYYFNDIKVYSDPDWARIHSRISLYHEILGDGLVYQNDDCCVITGEDISGARSR